MHAELNVGLFLKMLPWHGLCVCHDGVLCKNSQLHQDAIYNVKKTKTNSKILVKSASCYEF